MLGHCIISSISSASGCQLSAATRTRLPNVSVSAAVRQALDRGVEIVHSVDLMGQLSLTELRGVRCIRSPDRLRSRSRMHRADSNVSHCLRDGKDCKLAELWRGPRTEAGRTLGFPNPSPSAPPSALTPVAVQLRTVGARRAIPRRIHGVRLAISATARSDRRIAVRGPGVGVDSSCASGDPTRGPW
jgi:hypothetical protein